MSTFSDPFVLLSIGAAALAVVLLVWFLVRRPPLTRNTKIVLLFGIGLLPLATAANGNVAGYHATKTTQFCTVSCHVMTPYGDDSTDRASTSLAARHARNEAFGDENCYACHADYGMFGTITTKIGGMRHVYEYAFNFHQLSLEEAIPRIHIRKPFQNATCMRCHSTLNQTWNAVPDHASTLVEVRAGTLSCASEGCHGPAHPFSKAMQLRARQQMSPPAVSAEGTP
ncbi:MAG: NapC/NirT family cytochrome c [Myxococcota bacterium]|nr:NapC/NirT family cytochrome c [Myxococcota bacterium]